MKILLCAQNDRFFIAIIWTLHTGVLIPASGGRNTVRVCRVSDENIIVYHPRMYKTAGDNKHVKDCMQIRISAPRGAKYTAHEIYRAAEHQKRQRVDIDMFRHPERTGKHGGA